MPRVKTKLAVHWASSVTITAPGWIVAVAAGAHCGAETALGVSPSQPTTDPIATAATVATRLTLCAPTCHPSNSCPTSYGSPPPVGSPANLRGRGGASVAPPRSIRVRSDAERQPVGVEGGRAEGQGDARPCRGSGRSSALGSGPRSCCSGAAVPVRPSTAPRWRAPGVEQRRAGVARDPRGDRVGGVGPAAAGVPRLTPVLGDSCVRPSRRLELPYVYNRLDAGLPVVLRPVGPPQCGIDGFTSP